MRRQRQRRNLRSQRHRRRLLVTPRRRHLKTNPATRKLIDMLAAVVKRKDSGRMRQHFRSRSLRRERILSELFKEDPFEQPALKSQRILAEISDPDPTIPYGGFCKYYQVLYDGIAFDINARSRGVIKNRPNWYEIPNFRRIPLIGQGLKVETFLPGLTFKISRAEIIMALKGRSNLDPFDQEMEATISFMDKEYLATIESEIEQNFIASFPAEFQSEDDKDLIAMKMPYYDHDEQFVKINYSYFDDKYIAHDHEDLPDSYIVRKRKSRYLKLNRKHLTKVQAIKKKQKMLRKTVMSAFPKEVMIFV